MMQSIAELRRCHDSYLDSLTMNLLSARKNTCVNDDVLEQTRLPNSGGNSSRDVKTVDQGCRAALSLTGDGCKFNNFPALRRTADGLNRDGVWDIEDAVWMVRCT